MSLRGLPGRPKQSQISACFSIEKFKLKKGGAKYTGADVEQDGLIITGKGPRAANEFGKTIANALIAP